MMPSQFIDTYPYVMSLLIILWAIQEYRRIERESIWNENEEDEEEEE